LDGPLQYHSPAPPPQITAEPTIIPSIVPRDRDTWLSFLFPESCNHSFWPMTALNAMRRKYATISFVHRKRSDKISRYAGRFDTGWLSTCSLSSNIYADQGRALFLSILLHCPVPFRHIKTHQGVFEPLGRYACFHSRGGGIMGTVSHRDESELG
jgi:hypothetical protein